MKGDGHDAKKFSIVMPFHDTPRERKFALKSIPSVIKLNPTEFVIGIDEPAKDDLPAYITGICAKNGFENVRLIRVPRTKDWNFQLAHVIWECFHACVHDKILGCDVDNKLRGAVMLGYDLIGKDNTAVVSFTKKILMRTVWDCIRYIRCRIRIKNTDFTFSGSYWIYKPYYFANVKKSEMQKIYNLIDGCMVDSIMRQKTHKIVTRKEIGVSCMDYQNEDYPWRQFADGIWLYANKHTLKATDERFRERSTNPVRWTVRYIVNRFPILVVMHRSFVNQHPVMTSGWRWAVKHRDSEAVEAAAGMSLADWQTYGASKHVKRIKRFKGGTTGLR